MYTLQLNTNIYNCIYNRLFHPFNFAVKYDLDILVRFCHPYSPIYTLLDLQSIVQYSILITVKNVLPIIV